MKIKKHSKQPAGTTRRGFLQGLGAAFAGAGIATAAMRPAAQPFKATLKLEDELTPAFDAQLIDANGNPMTALAPGTYQSGMMFFRTTGTDGNGQPYNDVQFVDVQDQTSAFSLLSFFTSGELPKTPFAAPVVNSTTLYTATGNNVYEVDVNGSTAIIWAPVPSPIVSNLLLLGQKLIFATGYGEVWVCNINTRSGAPIATGLSASSISLTAANSYLYVQGGSSIAAINLTTSALAYGPQPSLSGTVTIGSGSLLVGGNTSVAAYDPATGQSLWVYPSSGSLTGPISAPIYSNHQVYIADGAGILHEINAESGQQTTQYTVGNGGAVGSLFLEDGVLYVSYNESSSMVIYGMELDNQNTTTYTTNSTGTFLGLENGLVCFTHLAGANVAGVNMTNVLHGFTCDSTLIEDYVPDGTGSAPHNSSYHTVVTLLDPNYNARANKAVKVWASDSALLVVDGVQYNIDSDNSIWLNTDSAGQLTLVVTELDNSPNNVPITVHCPALYLWGTFMETGEAIVIYPDHVTVNKLSTTQGSDLSTAQDFNGNKFTVGSGAEALASSLRNTMGGVNESLQLVQTRNAAHMALLGSSRSTRRSGHRRKPVLRDDPNKYQAYPGSTPNMLYFGDAANQNPERPSVMGSSQFKNW